MPYFEEYVDLWILNAQCEKLIRELIELVNRRANEQPTT